MMADNHGSVRLGVDVDGYDQVLACFENDARDAELVSFDMFDTLLLRTLRKPTDLFRVVARDLERRLFPGHVTYAGARIAAEREARRVARADRRRDVTLEEIYGHLDPRFMATLAAGKLTPADLMALEIHWELACARPDPKVVAIFQRLIARGARVIILSDMYLPSTALTRMAEKIGAINHAILMVSCEEGACKADGSIWEKVRARFNLGPDDRIVHIGDHAHSDGAAPRQHGIRAHVIPAFPERGKVGRLGDGSHWFVGACESLLRERLFGPRLTTWEAYWLEIAYLLVLPIVIGMAAFTADVARLTGSRGIFFLARDGLIFKKAYDALSLDGAPPSHYLWASRRCLNMASVDVIDDHALTFLASGPDLLSPNQYLRRIDLDPEEAEIATIVRARFAEPSAPIKPSETANLTDLFHDLAPQILARAGYEREGLMRHIAQLGLFETNVAIVMDLGWHGTLQRSLIRLGRKTRAADFSLTGLYLGTYADAPRDVDGVPVTIRGWLFDRGKNNPPLTDRDLRLNASLIELLFSAPTPGVNFIAVQGDATQPVGTLDPQEEHRLKIAGLLHDVVQTAVPLLRELAGFVDDAEFRKLCAAQIKTFQDVPTAIDAVVFGDVLHAEGFGAARYQPLVAQPYHGLNPARMLESLQQTNWRRAYLSAMKPAKRPINYLVMLAGRLTGRL